MQCSLGFTAKFFGQKIIQHFREKLILAEAVCELRKQRNLRSMWRAVCDGSLSESKTADRRSSGLSNDDAASFNSALAAASAFRRDVRSIKSDTTLTLVQSRSQQVLLSLLLLPRELLLSTSLLPLSNPGSTSGATWSARQTTIRHVRPSASCEYRHRWNSSHCRCLTELRDNSLRRSTLSVHLRQTSAKFERVQRLLRTPLFRRWDRGALWLTIKFPPFNTSFST